MPEAGSSLSKTIPLWIRTIKIALLATATATAWTGDKNKGQQMCEDENPPSKCCHDMDHVNT